jgi:hypothetical protein
VSIRYVELVDYLAIAAEVTGLDTSMLTRVAKIDLAESALHVPAAGFGETHPSTPSPDLELVAGSSDESAPGFSL